MAKRALLLDDFSYKAIMMERRSPGHPPVLQYSGKVKDALQRVVEHFSFVTEHGVSQISPSVVLIPANESAVRSNFRDLYCELDKPNGTGSMEAGGFWNSIRPRAEDGDPSVTMSWKSLKYIMPQKTDEYLVVKIRSVNAVENSIILKVKSVYHADGKLKVFLDGVLPSKVLDLIVVLQGVSPLVDGIHALEHAASDGGICIRLQQRLGNNGVLYDSSEAQGSASARFAYSVDSSQELHHILLGNTSLFDMERIRMPLRDSVNPSKEFDQHRSGKDKGDFEHAPAGAGNSLHHGHRMGPMLDIEHPGPPMQLNDPLGGQQRVELNHHPAQARLDPPGSITSASNTQFGTAQDSRGLGHGQASRSHAIHPPQLGRPQANPTGQCAVPQDAQMKAAPGWNQSPASQSGVSATFSNVGPRIGRDAWLQGKLSRQPGAVAPTTSLSEYPQVQNSARIPVQQLQTGSIPPAVGIGATGAFSAQQHPPGQSLEQGAASNISSYALPYGAQNVQSISGFAQRVAGNPHDFAEKMNIVGDDGKPKNMLQRPGHSGSMNSNVLLSSSGQDCTHEGTFDIWSELCKSTVDVRNLCTMLHSRGMAKPLQEMLAQMSIGGTGDQRMIAVDPNNSPIVESSQSPLCPSGRLGSQPLRFEHLPFLKLDGYMNPYKNKKANQQPDLGSHLTTSNIAPFPSGPVSDFQRTVDAYHNQSQSVPPSPARSTIPEPDLRSYQRKAVDTIMSRDGNFLVRAPTGSGKTWIFVECARRMIVKNTDAKIIVLVPTVPLVHQQKLRFDEAGFSANGYFTKSVSGGKPLKREQFLQSSVLVMTVQILENKLNDKSITFRDFHMLVLDEGHHARGESPYSKVLGLYRCQPDSQRQSVKNLVDINESDEEIIETVPKAAEEVYWIDRSEEDSVFVNTMTSFLRETLRIYHEHLNKLGLGCDLSVPLPRRIKPGECLSQLSQWKHQASEAVTNSETRGHEADLLASLNFIGCINSAIAGVPELGHAVVLRIIKDYLKETVDLEKVEARAAASSLETLVKRYCELAPVRMASGAPNMPMAEPTSSNCGTLSRFAALEDILSREQFSGDNFHGIVFVRTRTAVKEGMTGAMQSEVVAWFKSYGRKVLVATSAAEEGLDVQACELVVRYSVTVTGVERIQSRGRARKKHALYINIVERASREEIDYHKSKRQEEAGEVVMGRVQALAIARQNKY